MLDQLASEVAILLGESLALECQPEESPFPGIKDRVRILAPGILATILILPPPDITLDGTIEISDKLYHQLLLKLVEAIPP